MADQTGTAPVRTATVALAHTLALHDPDQSGVDARRALLAADVAREQGLGEADRQVAVAAALLCDVAALLSRPRSRRGDTGALTALSATLLERIDGMGPVATAVRNRLERADGSGRPRGLTAAEIPATALVLAEADRRLEQAGRPPASLDRALALLDDQPSPAPLPPPTTAAELMGAVGRILRAVDRVEHILAHIADLALGAVGADTVTIAKIDEAEGVLQVLVNVGRLADDEEQFPLDELYALDAVPDLARYRSGTGTLRTSGGDDRTARYLADRGITSEAVTPLIVDDALWGIAWATTSGPTPPLDPASVTVLGIVADQMAAGISQAARYSEFEELAFRDPLTGLGNRRVLEATLRDVFARPPAEREIAVIMADVDELKVVNDTMGHEAGDDVLVEASRALSAAAATITGASVCRVGGDEFCVVIVGAETDHATQIAERALELFRATGPGRSMSCGVAVASPQMETSSDLLRAADIAQYERKRRHKEAAGLPVPAEPGTHGRRRRRDG